MSAPVDVLVAGRSIYKTTTHVIFDGHRILSQHKSQGSASRLLAKCKASVNYSKLAVLPVAEALARVGGGK